MSSAAIVGHLGARQLRAGQGMEATELKPLYLRPAGAESKRRVVARA
jgi:hypothetical protein